MSFAASDSVPLAMADTTLSDGAPPQREAPLLSYLAERPCPLPSRILEFLIPCSALMAVALYISAIHRAGAAGATGSGTRNFGIGDPFLLAGLGIAIEQFWVRYRAFLALTKLRAGGVFEQLMVAPGFTLRDWLTQLAIAKERQSFPFRLGVIGGLTLSFLFWFTQGQGVDFYLVTAAIAVYIYAVWRVISYLDREESFARGHRTSPLLMEVPVLFTRTPIGAVAVALILPAFTIAFVLIITFHWSGLFLVLGLFGVLQAARMAAMRMDARQEADPFESAMREALKLGRTGAKRHHKTRISRDPRSSKAGDLQAAHEGALDFTKSLGKSESR